VALGKALRKGSRRARRAPVAWQVRFRIAGGTAERWHECRVLDVSVAGAGLEVAPGDAALLARGRLVVELGLAGDVSDGGGGGLQLTAWVRHVTADDGATRVGITFVNMTALERDILGAMVARRAEAVLSGSR
jgi:hypothetical protein